MSLLASLAVVALLIFVTLPPLLAPEGFLANDPPPPVHTGGEPYPPGTFPPELVPLWENATEDLQRPGAYWGDGACQTAFALDGSGSNFGFVADQWLLEYDEELEDPEAMIAEELRAAGVEFESITVRDAAYYDERYDPETFINWLAPENRRFDPLAAMERLGGELHGDARARFAEISGSLDIRIDIRITNDVQQALYQVKVHGYGGGISVLDNAYQIGLHDRCPADDHERSQKVLLWLAGGLYTTFGDDVVLRGFEPEWLRELFESELEPPANAP